MTAVGVLRIVPLAVLAAAAIATLLLVAIRRHHAATAALCALGLALALAAVPLAAARAPAGEVTPLIVVDGYTLFFQGLIVLAALAVALLSYGYLARRETVPREEYYVLLLTATLGAATLVASRHFASFFLGLETLSLSLVALVAYPAAAERPVEAGLKYLILSGISSAFLLLGIALVYFVGGRLSLGALSLAVTHAAVATPLTAAPPGLVRLFGLCGLALILVGLGFKLSIVPFHLWAPDVYEGAPAPITAFVAVVSKTAVLALLLRYYLAAGAFGADPALAILSCAATLSMIVGNLLALLQSNVKRILAYSSIAHLGYALVAFLAGGALAVEAVSVYLVAYAISTLGAFGVVSMLSGAAGLPRAPGSPEPEEPRDADDLEDYRGLFRARPWLAAAFTVVLLSLAGIPITVGFIAKFYAVTSGVGASLGIPIGALVAGSILGLYYYLRIVAVMIDPARSRSEPAGSAAQPAIAISGGVIAILVALLVGLGVYPAPLVGLIRATSVTLAGTESGPLGSAQLDPSARAPAAADTRAPGASSARLAPPPRCVDSRASGSETACSPSSPAEASP